MAKNAVENNRVYQTGATIVYKQKTDLVIGNFFN